MGSTVGDWGVGSWVWEQHIIMTDTEESLAFWGDFQGVGKERQYAINSGTYSIHSVNRRGQTSRTRSKAIPYPSCLVC
jgi:hypothetical protein